jgi:hypothetical protein
MGADTGDTTVPHLFYCNALFDLSLRTDKPKLSPATTRIIAEMTQWFIPLAARTDYIELDISPPEEYFQYCKEHGIETPSQAVPGQKIPCGEPVVWGWNSEAVHRLKQYDIPLHYPNLDSVKKVNARDFGYALAEENGWLIPGAALVKSIDELIEYCTQTRHFPIVIKPRFGNSAMDFSIIGQSHSPESLRRTAGRYFSRSDAAAVVVEPWVTRTMDISSRMYIERDGALRLCTHHRCFNSSAGVVYATWIEPGRESFSQWVPSLDRAAETVAAALHRQGYFGPAGLDSFCYRDDCGQQRCILCNDCNARHTLSVVNYALRDRLAPRSHSMLRYLGSRRITMPDSYEEWKRLLGNDLFDTRSRSGCILVTPLYNVIDGKKRLPHRSGFFIAAQSEKQMWEIERRLLQTVLKNKDGA